MKENVEKLGKFIQEYYVHLVVFVTATAVLGSLTFSNLLELPPCDLCWWQRIFFFPLAILSVVGVVKQDKKVDAYLWSLAIPGFLIAVYHYIIQMLTANGLVDFSATCSANNPCTELQFVLGGFITIPLMSAFGFLTVIIILGLKNYFERQAK